MQIQQPGPTSQARFRPYLLPLEGPEGSDYTPPLMAATEPEPQSDELYVSQTSEV